MKKALCVLLIYITCSVDAAAQNTSLTAARNDSNQTKYDIVCEDSKIYDASTSGNTELVTLVSGKTIYVCKWMFYSGGTVSVSLVTGTGTACASAASGTPSTGTSGASAGLTPALQLTVGLGWDSQTPTHGSLVSTGTSNALCLKTSGAVAVMAQVWYSQRTPI